MLIRYATPDDAGRLLEIYSYYVENTAITFEIDVPSHDEFVSRITKTLKRYPYLVLEEDGRIEGYAYACIADPVTEDEYLTRDSERFHRCLGYEKAGEFHKCGYKFSHWYNMIWMEKLIGGHD